MPREQKWNAGTINGHASMPALRRGREKEKPIEYRHDARLMGRFSLDIAFQPRRRRHARGKAK